MTVADSSAAGWRTSSYSGYNGNCVVVGQPDAPGIGVRDSALAVSPVLTFPAANWSTFVARLAGSAAGEFLSGRTSPSTPA